LIRLRGGAARRRRSRTSPTSFRLTWIADQHRLQGALDQPGDSESPHRRRQHPRDPDRPDDPSARGRVAAAPGRCSDPPLGMLAPLAGADKRPDRRSQDSCQSLVVATKCSQLSVALSDAASITPPRGDGAAPWYSHATSTPARSAASEPSSLTTGQYHSAASSPKAATPATPTGAARSADPATAT
jgi:hypothetical protein